MELLLLSHTCVCVRVSVCAGMELDFLLDMISLSASSFCTSVVIVLAAATFVSAASTSISVSSVRTCKATLEYTDANIFGDLPCPLLLPCPRPTKEALDRLFQLLIASTSRSPSVPNVDPSLLVVVAVPLLPNSFIILSRDCWEEKRLHHENASILRTVIELVSRIIIGNDGP